MNSDKAREFFSAYHDGTLESGLRKALDQKFNVDKVLAADYSAFAETIRDLNALKDEQIDIPMFLSDRIATQLEAVSAAPKARFSLLQAWRGIAFAGLATAIVAVALITSNSQPASQEVAVGNMIGNAPAVNADQLKFDYKDGAVLVAYNPTSPKTVVIASGTTGKELKRFNLNGRALQSPLTNDLSSTALFSIQVLGEKSVSLLALPGTERSTERDGTGDLSKFAIALASYYHVPVLVQAADQSKGVSWQFRASDPRSAATDALANTGISADQRSDGLIVLL